MKIKSKFDERQLELIAELHIDIEQDFNKERLEDFEDKVYNKMMDNLDSEQNFTDKATEYENILDIVVDIENNYND
jgi:hypothetical protein|uniref:Uncharacterized protein n=1 Tax=Siphoviridae sp. cthh925 TaxID=2826425 RepID=A0A8S5NN46_9CAUD|nr:MAG TPA: hypothetical protein [Siphoviridae sp. cthh925]DAM81886.1 MAG TPA: hypothetical protein [Caudoviricetes sp.]